MSDPKRDAIEREIGAKSASAVDALSLAFWDESKQVFLRARADMESGELTPERALMHLTAILQSNLAYERLLARVEEGIRAGQRIARTFEIQAEKEAAPPRVGNRFMRSHVDHPKAS